MVVLARPRCDDDIMRGVNTRHPGIQVYTFAVKKDCSIAIILPFVVIVFGVWFVHWFLAVKCLATVCRTQRNGTCEVALVSEVCDLVPIHVQVTCYYDTDRKRKLVLCAPEDARAYIAAVFPG